MRPDLKAYRKLDLCAGQEVPGIVAKTINPRSNVVTRLGVDEKKRYRTFAFTPSDGNFYMAVTEDCMPIPHTFRYFAFETFEAAVCAASKWFEKNRGELLPEVGTPLSVINENGGQP